MEAVGGIIGDGRGSGDPGADPLTDGDILVGGSTFTNWPELEAEKASGQPEDSELLGHEDSWLIIFLPSGNYGGWSKQFRSQG